MFSFNEDANVVVVSFFQNVKSLRPFCFVTSSRIFFSLYINWTSVFNLITLSYRNLSHFSITLAAFRSVKPAETIRVITIGQLK